MKKIAIVTIQSINYGNRLQNYALSKYLNRYGKCKSIHYLKKNCTMIGRLKKIVRAIRGKTKRDLFARFDLYIPYSRMVISESNDKLINSFDYFVAGSDQIWNPLFEFNSDREFLTFARPEQRIVYAASIGIDNLPEKEIERFRERISEIQYISMREQSGADIVKLLTGKEVPVVLDPTMLLTVEEWHEVSKKSKYQPKNKYIFKYILGIENAEFNQWIENYAKDYGLDIFDLKDVSKDDKMAIGPSEFISLIENSSLVCTDSFHGTVFSILFQRPFISFQRPEQEGYGNMNSRIDTLLKTFYLEDRKVCNIKELVNLSMNCDFKRVSNILEAKRSQADAYIKIALNIK